MPHYVDFNLESDADVNVPLLQDELQGTLGGVFVGLQFIAPRRWTVGLLTDDAETIRMVHQVLDAHDPDQLTPEQQARAYVLQRAPALIQSLGGLTEIKLGEFAEWTAADRWRFLEIVIVALVGSGKLGDALIDLGFYEAVEVLGWPTEGRPGE
jgi:hypothetical protein